MDHIGIELSTAELMIASTVGSMRRIGSIKKKLTTTYARTTKSDWATDIDGAAAEMAVARHYGVYWSGHVFRYKGSDVSDKIQVRSTDRQDGCLIVRPDDDSNEAFILVTSKAPIYTIRGFLWGQEAKQERYWRDDAWWVPQPDLYPLPSLNDLLEGQ